MRESTTEEVVQTYKYRLGRQLVASMLEAHDASIDVNKLTRRERILLGKLRRVAKILGTNGINTDIGE